MAKPLSARLAALLRRGARRIPWEDLTLEEATALAKRGGHVRKVEGRIVGSPRGRSLRAIRAGLDKTVREGREGAPWYQESQKALEEMSGGRPDVLNQLVEGNAIYSPQTPPDTALGWTLAQMNASVAEGPKKAAERTYHYGRQAKQFGKVIEEGGEAATGPKVREYRDKIDPRQAGKSHVRPVNDVWMGRTFGYTQRPRQGGKAQGRGFSDSEHSFMTGETLLAAQRAKAKGVLPEGVVPGVDTVQAAAWVGERKKALRRQHPEWSSQEVSEEAKKSIKDASEKFTAQETYELVPSRGSEHLAGVVDKPLDVKRSITDELLAADPGAGTGIDPYYEALGMAQRPTKRGLGQFTENVAADPSEPIRFQPAFKRLKDDKVFATVGFHDTGQLPGAETRGYVPHEWDEGFIDQYGKYYTRQEAAAAGGAQRSEWMDPEQSLTSERLTTRETHYGEKPRPKTDYNPNLTAKPMVAYAGKPTAAETFQPQSEQLVKGVNMLRSATDVQAAGAYHAVKLVRNARLQNAARLKFPEPLDNEMTAILYEMTQGAGLNLIDTGGGSFTVVGDFGQMPAAQFKKTFKELADSLTREGVEVKYGQYVGGYQELPAYGEGRVTRAVLESVQPEVGKLLDSPRLRRMWLRRNAAERSAAGKYGLGPPRKDVQKLRRLLGQGGVEGLRRHTWKKGFQGLPLVPLGLAAGGDSQ